MPEPVLSLKDFGIANGDRTIFSSISFDVPEKGVLNILGSAATEKSILIRTLSGVYKSNPKIRIWGEANYLGEPLGKAGYPSVAMQNTKLMGSSIQENIISNLPERKDLSPAEQRDIACRLLESSGLGELVDRLDMSVVDLPLETIRHLAIVRVSATNPPVIFLDEPTLGIDKKNTHKLLEYIKSESRKRAMVVAINDQEQAKLLGGQSMLLDEGWVQEYAPTTEFFSSPKSSAAVEFIINGDCAAPPPEVKPEEEKQYRGDVLEPKGFRWLKHGEIAGMPRPGVEAELQHDLEALERAGITHLISLAAEMKPVDADELARYGMSSSWMPFDDMGIPLIDRAALLCEEIGQLISKGHVIAVHCEGFGRTGTVLALHLIWEGLSTLQALELIRKIEPQWAHSVKQKLFLDEFAHELAAEGSPAAT